MDKSYKYRIYPNKQQEELIQKTFGCCRFVYNYYLNKRIELYKNENKSLKYSDCSKDLTMLKQEYIWLKEPDKFALQNSIKNLESAYINFYRKNAKFPKFKSKKNYNSYKTNNGNNNTSIMFLNNHIKLPKLGYVKTRDKQIPEGRILNATISQEPNGQYYCSICCTEVEINEYSKTNNIIGLDFGIKNFVTTSDGEIIENPKYLQKSLDKLVKLQRELSRKTIGSSNYNKARIKIAKLYNHIVNQRRDFLQKLSTDMVKKYDLICIEDLKIQELLQKSNNIREIKDVSWGNFSKMLQYKSNWHDKKLIIINQFFPSSQLCNVCGYKNKDIKNLNLREWDCPCCHTHHNRDINAAINILNEGLRIA